MIQETTNINNETEFSIGEDTSISKLFGINEVKIAQVNNIQQP